MKLLFCCLRVNTLKFLRFLLWFDLVAYLINIVVLIFFAGIIEKVYGLITTVVYLPILGFVMYKIFKTRRITEKAFSIWVGARSIIIMGHMVLEILTWLIVDHVTNVRAIFIIHLIVGTFNLFYNFSLWKRVRVGKDTNLNELFLDDEGSEHKKQRLFLTDRN